MSTFMLPDIKEAVERLDQGVIKTSGGEVIACPGNSHNKPMDGIPAKTFAEAIAEYYRTTNPMSQRLGQFLCNKFDVADDNIFYTEDPKVAIKEFATYLI